MEWDIQRINNIKQEDFLTFIEINFAYNNGLYVLRINEEAGKWIPTMVFHQGYEKCPLCHQSSVYCSVLSKKRNEIFQHVIQENSIRLLWLYNEVNIK